MKKIGCILSILFFTFFAFAAPPDTGFFVDLATPTIKFEYTTFAGNTPSFPVQVLTNGLPYNGFSGYTPQFNYFTKDSSSAGKTISGTLSGSIVTFVAVTNSFPVKGDFFAEVFFINGASKITAGQGTLHVNRSPSGGSYGDLNLSPRINWDAVVNLGTPPWAAGAEPVFFASAAYGITSTQTSNWTTAYTHSQADTVTSNSGNWAGTWGGLTTNSLSTTASVALITADVTELKGKTSGWDTAQSNGSIATNFIATNTLQAQITANLTNQNATNILFLASTASLQSQITANLTNQNATNTSLQSQISGLASTNSFVSFQTNQIATNALLLAQITTVRTNQAATNAIFQAFNTAQTITNAWFQYWFGLQADSNSLFQGLFDTQVDTNASLLAQIVTNAVIQSETNLLLLAQINSNATYQTSTNTLFESRITSNEVFRITTQPATNLSLQGQITSNLTNQNATNSSIQSQVTLNLTNQNATNVLLQTVDSLITNDIYITSNAFVLADGVVFTNLMTNLMIASNALASSISGAYLTTNTWGTSVASHVTSSDTSNWTTAYGWGNHATNGYLTVLGNIFPELTTADRSVLGTNLSGLTQGTYTGSLTTVSYTGVTDFVVGRTYTWGFTKATAAGTSTLSVATYSLTKTAAGATSNYFTYSGSTDSNLVLKLDGDGSAKSDVTGLYVRQITNGDVNVAGDINVGGTFYVNGVDINNLPGVSTNLSDFNNDAGFITTIASSAVWNKAATDAEMATNETATLRLATNSLQTQISNIGGIMYRYVAMATASEQIEVLATTTNITAARVGTTVTMTIPAGTRLLSMRLRWDGVNNGSTFNLNLGTNDMSNSGVTDRWGAMFFAYREDTGALIAGASCRLDTSNYDVLIIQGLPTACISNCRFGF
jgi:hypothetical protein